MMSNVRRSLRRSLLAAAAIAWIASSARARADGVEPPPEPEPTAPAPEDGKEGKKEKLPEEAPPPSKHRMRSIPSPDEEPSVRHVSLTWLPIQLLLPMVALAAEVRFSDEASGTIFGGYGTVRVDRDQTDERDKRSAYQLGAQFHYYVSGAFDLGGVHVGAEVLFVHVADSSWKVATTAVVPGLTVGPFVGFKLVTRSGFTFDSQIGIGIAAATTSGAAPNDPEQKVSLMGNLGVGWTF
jgi:hypothetical protein